MNCQGGRRDQSLPLFIPSFPGTSAPQKLWGSLLCSLHTFPLPSLLAKAKLGILIPVREFCPCHPLVSYASGNSCSSSTTPAGYHLVADCLRKHACLSSLPVHSTDGNLRTGNFPPLHSRSVAGLAGRGRRAKGSRQGGEPSLPLPSPLESTGAS